MPRFFVTEVNDTDAVVTGPDAVHIGRSLRMKLGDELILCKNNVEYNTIIKSISDEAVVCKIVSKCRTESEPDISLTLFQAMPKLDKLETIIQKATELGAIEIVPVLTRRCVSRPDEKSFSKKLERLEKIALEAAKQSGRGIIPKISGIIDTAECIRRISLMDTRLVCYEQGGVSLSDINYKSGGSIGLFIGSEGGFDEAEIESCNANGIVSVGLGKRILRCETAPLSAISIIMHLTGNM